MIFFKSDFSIAYVGRYDFFLGQVRCHFEEYLVWEIIF